jgi:hypothetical protein
MFMYIVFHSLQIMEISLLETMEAQLAVILSMKHIVLETERLDFAGLWKRLDNRRTDIIGIVQHIEALSDQVDTSLGS